MLLVGDSPRLPTAAPPCKSARASPSACRWPTACARCAADGKSILLLWLWGGPPHLDTFDPKPDAPLEFRGPFASIPTRTPGLRFGELFPQLAAAVEPLRRHPLAAHAVERPRRRRHHRPDRQHGRGGRPRRQVRSPAPRGRPSGRSSRASRARPRRAAAVLRRRRQAAPGQEADRRRGRRPPRPGRATRSASKYGRGAEQPRPCNCRRT